jgi:hypothetical protein
MMNTNLYSFVATEIPGDEAERKWVEFVGPGLEGANAYGFRTLDYPALWDEVVEVVSLLGWAFDLGLRGIGSSPFREVKRRCVVVDPWGRLYSGIGCDFARSLNAAAVAGAKLAEKGLPGLARSKYSYSVRMPSDGYSIKITGPGVDMDLGREGIGGSSGCGVKKAEEIISHLEIAFEEGRRKGGQLSPFYRKAASGGFLLWRGRHCRNTAEDFAVREYHGLYEALEGAYGAGWQSSDWRSFSVTATIQ